MAVREWGIVVSECGGIFGLGFRSLDLCPFALGGDRLALAWSVGVIVLKKPWLSSSTQERRQAGVAVMDRRGRLSTNGAALTAGLLFTSMTERRRGP
jgi:hypothetical protein